MCGRKRSRDCFERELGKARSTGQGGSGADWACGLWAEPRQAQPGQARGATRLQGLSPGPSPQLPYVITRPTLTPPGARAASPPTSSPSAPDRASCIIGPNSAEQPTPKRAGEEGAGLQGPACDDTRWEMKRAGPRLRTAESSQGRMGSRCDNTCRLHCTIATAMRTAKRSTACRRVDLGSWRRLAGSARASRNVPRSPSASERSRNLSRVAATRAGSRHARQLPPLIRSSLVFGSRAIGQISIHYPRCGTNKLIRQQRSRRGRT